MELRNESRSFIDWGSCDSSSHHAYQTSAHLYKAVVGGINGSNYLLPSDLCKDLV